MSTYDAAIAVSADWPKCVVRRLGTDESIPAIESAAMQEHYIRIRAGDLVRVDFGAEPAEVVRRHGWRATVLAVEGDRVTFDSKPNGTIGVAAVPTELGFSPAVGDAVFVRNVQEPVVVDKLVGDEPAHPDRFEG
jgi:hypothetical protein